MASVSSEVRITAAAGSVVVTNEVTVAVRSGRVVVVGRDISHSEGAEFTVALPATPWWRLLRRRPRVWVL